ncbi:MAG: carboxypeptidase-like regulatory domain-containing protein, partial [Acidobacteriota bacterium]
SMTDGEGTATVTDLVPGTFDLEVSAEGYRPHRRTGLDLDAGGRSIDAVLERGVTLVGRVLEPSGAPAGESMVRLDLPNSSPMNFSRSRAFSDSDGRFSLDGLDAGAHTVVAQHATWGEVKKRIEVGPDGATVELRFSDDGASVAGLVLDGATGEAVVGARVHLQQGQNAGFFGGGRLETKTDFEGRFRFAVVPPGTYRPVASHDGYAATEGEAIEIDELSVDGITLELGGGEAIVGRVTGVPFERLGSLSLMALSSTGGMQHATPDYEGAFRFGHLAPGAWTVRASLPDGAQVSERVMLAEGDGEVEIELELGSGITISGQVLRSGAGASGLRIRATHKTATIFSEVRTDLDGRFRLEGLEAGTYAVLVDDRGRTVWRQDREIRADDDWVLELRSAAVSGRVVDAAGQALGGASLRLLRADSEALTTLSSRSITADDAGRFEFGEVADGSYRLLASKASYAQAERQLTVAEVPQTDLLITLERGAGLTFQPRRAIGGTPSTVRYLVLDGADQMISSGEATVDDAGTVLLDSLAPGAYRLLVADAGGPTVEVPAESPGDAGVVTLPRGGTLQVDMPSLFLDGGGADVDIRLPDGRLYRSVDSAFAWGGWLRGSQYQRRLPAGSYTVDVKASDGQTWQFPVTLVDGGVTELRVP